MKTFDKLENRYIFTGTIKTSEAMHIGTGEGGEMTDSTFVKNNGGFYIPGSSLRGVLRSTVERIISSLGVYTCMLSKDDGTKCITICRETQEEYQNMIEKGQKEIMLVEWIDKGNRLCNTCKVFGSTHFASKVKFTDLHLKSESGNNPQGIIRTGICIDRDTGTASDGALFDFEVIEKGFRFDFELIAENLEGEDFGILSIGLQELLKGSFYVGGRTSVGLGKCILNDDVSIRYFDNSDSTYTLKKYLIDDEMGTIPEPKEWIKEKVQTYLSQLCENKG